MANPCSIYKNPIRRDGTSQNQRLLATFDTNYALIDERNIFDILNYAYRYAQYIKYYNNNNESNDWNWQPFFDNDFVKLSFLLGRNNINAEYKKLKDQLTSSSAVEDLRELVDFVLLLLNDFDKLQNNSVIGSEKNNAVKGTIKASLANLLKTLIAYEKGAEFVFNSSPNEYEVNKQLYYTLSFDWITDSPAISWDDYIDNIAKDETIFSGSTINKSTINALDALINGGFLLVILPFLQEIEEQFDIEASVKDKQNVEPYFALFLSFLQIFKHAQNHINTFTKKHLDFYYREVLQLEQKPANPDTAHILFELAKGINQHLIEEGTLLNAGKDELGQDVLFKTDKEIVVNTTKVASLKTVTLNNNRIYRTEVANSSDGLGSDVDASPWKLFGESGKNETEIGFAIASPQLLMREGTRTATISITCNQTIPSVSSDKFSILLSGEENWISPASLPSITRSGNTITFEIILDRDKPAVVPYNSEILGGNFTTKWPIVKILIKESSTIYNSFKTLKLNSFSINVDVKEVTNLIVQNDEGQLDPSKPFFPFTNNPKKNSAFYIGSAEIFRKKLTSLDVNIVWQGAPTERTSTEDNFRLHYKEYKRGSAQIVSGNHYFTARASLLDDYKWIDLSTTVPINYNANILSAEAVSVSQGVSGVSNVILLLIGLFLMFIDQFRIIDGLALAATYAFFYGRAVNKKLPLFVHNKTNDSSIILTPEGNIEGQTFGDATVPRKILVKNAAADDLTFSKVTGYNRDITSTELSPYSASTKRGFIKFELDNDFLHNLYPNLLTNTVILKGQSNDPDSITLPKQPYTPIIKALSLDYTSSHTVEFASQTFGDRVEQVFHIGPFGETEIFHENSNNKINEPNVLNTPFIFPQFDELGSLYIGLSGLNAPQNLSLLFQFAEGTENPDARAPRVIWSYLSNNQWKQFENAAIDDATQGLLTKGIVTLSIPKDITPNNTYLPNELYWIKASALRESQMHSINAFSDVLTVKSQAITASFSDNENDSNRLLDPLPSETISKLQERRSSVKTVTQPYPSFNGKISETGISFYRRVSERLRHKHRALTIHDIEHLILERYPDIFKVKCINHFKDIDNTKHAELAPGNLCVALIPNVKQYTNAQNPFELKLSPAKRQEIKTYLESIATPLANIEVRNPDYDAIEVTAKVTFRKGFDETFYSKQLSQDIKRFIAPWSFGEIEKIAFGGKLDSSVLVNFIEELSYVNYITSFTMKQSSAIVQEANAINPTTILTSSNTHKINEITS